MTNFRTDLASTTPPEWADYILENFDEFLIDHANCERKASALAMSFVVKYADRPQIIPPLIDLAQEELEHFRQIYVLMEKRGLRIMADIKDPYVNALLEGCRSGKEDRFMDRLLVSSLVETRGAERFRLIHQALEDAELKELYRDLWACEAKHGNLFVQLAMQCFPEDEVKTRLADLAQMEAAVVAGLKWRPSLH